MKFIRASTLMDEEEYKKLVKAFGNNLDEKIEHKLELALEDLVLEAEKVIGNMPATEEA